MISHHEISSYIIGLDVPGTVWGPVCSFDSLTEVHRSAEKTTALFPTEPNRSDSVLTLAIHVIIITAIASLSVTIVFAHFHYY